MQEMAKVVLGEVDKAKKKKVIEMVDTDANILIYRIQRVYPVPATTMHTCAASAITLTWWRSARHRTLEALGSLLLP